jgi:predicted ribosome quality control (RQC) complex YloA/Tae2 family protein
MAGERNDQGGYRAFEKDGFEILVGKSARENDRLTFRVAQLSDLWLHASGYAGSHVVIRNPLKKEIPRDVVECAAQLAAYHSKAQAASGKVDVHVCRVADVRKRADAPPGQVVLKRWDVVKVYVKNPFPDEPT